MVGLPFSPAVSGINSAQRAQEGWKIIKYCLPVRNFSGGGYPRNSREEVMKKMAKKVAKKKSHKHGKLGLHSISIKHAKK